MQTEAIYSLFLQSKGISIDTRNIKRGELFFALSGPNFNANLFAQTALEKGALAVVVDQKKFAIDERFILVSDCLKQLQVLANYYRKQLNCRIIAVCGSNGKTTSKELIAHVLNSTFSTFSTPGNYNNHIGVPLSLLMIKAEHAFAIIEMGANHAGEHTLLCQIAEPDFGLITNNGKDHLEGFGSIEGVIAANRELYLYLETQGKPAFINADDSILMKNSENLTRIIYGTAANAACSATLLSTFPFAKVKLNFSTLKNCILINSQLFGSFQLYNLALAACIGNHFGVSQKNIKTSLESYIPTNMRSQLLIWQSNEILLDTYNANPSSVMAILTDFCKYKHEKKAVILGDMLELGDASYTEHKAVMNYLAQQKLEFVLLVGKEFKLHQNQNFHYFSNQLEAKEWLMKNKIVQHSILIKGSRALKLEKIVE